MAAFEVIALDTATPQLRAPGAADTYTFPRAVEMPLGTANGVLYLNGSKVVTSGSGLTFDGTTFVLPSGNVSIGASASGRVLEIFNGDAVNLQRLRLTTSGTDGVIQVTRNSGTVPNLIFQQDASELMRLTSTGLGIGTNNPQTRLEANQTGVGSVVIPIVAANQDNSATGTGAGIGFVVDGVNDVIGAQVAAIRTAGAYHASALAMYTRDAAGGGLLERARLDSSGNLGLGVTPSAWGSYRSLSVGTAGTTIWQLGSDFGLSSNAYNNSGWKYNTTGGAALYDLAENQHLWYIAPSWDGTGSNAISFTQAMTLDANGNLLVGTTSAELGASFGNIQIQGSSGAIVQAQTGAGTVKCAISTDSSNGYTGTRTNHPLLLITNNTERARIPAAGGMVVGTAALATTATDGFLYVPTCAGTPTGTPTTQTGTAPIVVDTTNNKLYFYSGGQWRDAGP